MKKYPNCFHCDGRVNDLKTNIPLCSKCIKNSAVVRTLGVTTASDYCLSKTDYLQNCTAFLFAINQWDEFVDKVQSYPSMSFYLQSQPDNCIKENAIDDYLIDNYDQAETIKMAYSEFITKPIVMNSQRK